MPDSETEIGGTRHFFLSVHARPVYFLALACGFAPINSLIEHDLSLEVADIHLH